MVGNVTPLLLKTIDEYDDYVLFIDDLFITGIISEKAGIPRFHYKLIHKYNEKWNSCYNDDGVFCKYKVRLECKDSDRRLRLWTEFKNSNFSSKCMALCRKCVAMNPMIVLLFCFLFIIAFNAFLILIETQINNRFFCIIFSQLD